jgi:hypothetical protein
MLSLDRGGHDPQAWRHRLQVGRAEVIFEEGSCLLEIA